MYNYLVSRIFQGIRMVVRKCCFQTPNHNSCMNMLSAFLAFSHYIFMVMKKVFSATRKYHHGKNKFLQIPIAEKDIANKKKVEIYWNIFCP